ncbi:hypothetical protein F5878DRAFT_666413 [Lentinula raphanica]|uniref:Uncharacterized protein n=1 Tax=Lentinula raphanica TaxID=153919 RepID=A0AA38NXT1_9AGAR|nr:hypothetical protein F5878DRAFT_666413 [Lentinula raphanica]
MNQPLCTRVVARAVDEPRGWFNIWSYITCVEIISIFEQQFEGTEACLPLEPSRPPGQPGTPQYDASLPSFYPFLSGVGSVTDNSQADILPQLFLLSVSEYVCGSSKIFSLRGIYHTDNGRGRWSNTPFPMLGSNMVFHGNCSGVNNGALNINIHTLSTSPPLSQPPLLILPLQEINAAPAANVPATFPLATY